MRLKKCYKCLVEKEIDQFSRNKNKKDNRNIWCKACFKVHNCDYQKRNREKINKTQKKWRDKIREQFLNAYGNKCKCCGESNPHFLTLDHINNDGYVERKLFGITNPTRMFLKMRKQNWPKNNYQILCMNCNFGKERLGQCPHKLE